MLNYAHYFDSRVYANVNDAMAEGVSIEDRTLPLEDRKLDRATLYICDTSNFVKVVTQGRNPYWYDLESGETFIITNEAEICPQGLKSRIASHVDPPIYFVIILCPPALTQTPGLPKMYADLAGGGLTNTRPNTDVSPGHPLDPNTPLTPEMTVNLQFWVGMHIDQLRERTLSVILGRYLLFITAQKYSTRLFDRVNGESKTDLTNKGISLLSHG